MNFGRRILGKVTIGVIDYFLVVNKLDMDSGQVQWIYYVTRGAPLTAAEEIIASGVLTNISPSGQTLTAVGVPPDDPATYLTKIIPQLEAMVASALAPQKVVDWPSQADPLVTGYTLRQDSTGNLQLVKQNYGANPAQNQWIAVVTGYTGDFDGEGAYTTWAAQHNVNTAQLIALFNSFQT